MNFIIVGRSVKTICWTEIICFFRLVILWDPPVVKKTLTYTTNSMVSFVSPMKRISNFTQMCKNALCSVIESSNWIMTIWKTFCMYKTVSLVFIQKIVTTVRCTTCANVLIKTCCINKALKRIKLIIRGPWVIFIESIENSSLGLITCL